MNTGSFAPLLQTLFTELVDGSSEPSGRTYVLNQGDGGLLAADAWAAVLRTPREVSDVEAGWLAGSVAHFAYHMGAIRQIDRTTRGPAAEDEARALRRS